MVDTGTSSRSPASLRAPLTSVVYGFFKERSGWARRLAGLLVVDYFVDDLQRRYFAQVSFAAMARGIFAEQVSRASLDIRETTAARGAAARAVEQAEASLALARADLDARRAALADWPPEDDEARAVAARTEVALEEAKEWAVAFHRAARGKHKMVHRRIQKSRDCF